MKVLVRYGTLALCTFLFLSCGTALNEITVKSQSERIDIFKEVQKGEIIPGGFADLTITSSIKTHLEGYYLLESEKSLHGKPGYPFLINVDGQATTWRVDGQRENLPTYDQEGKRAPEGGDGMRYTLQERILLKEGSHMVLFGLPEEEIFFQFELTLNAGETYVLELRPVYLRRGKDLRHFSHGVKTCKVLLNGNAVKLLK